MTCSQALDKLKDLKLLKGIYIKLKNDPSFSMFGYTELTYLILKCTEETERLLSSMRNMEFDDSYSDSGEPNPLCNNILVIGGNSDK